MALFLSNEWFTTVAKLNEQAGDLPLPPTLQTLIINGKITGTDTELHLKSGKLYQGLNANAASTIVTDSETLQLLIGNKDKDAALEAFMTGKIRVEGDMSALLSLQSAKPTPEQKALYKAILEQTEF